MIATAPTSVPSNNVVLPLVDSDGMVTLHVPIPWQLWALFVIKATAQETTPEAFASLVLGAWQYNLDRQQALDSDCLTSES